MKKIVLLFIPLLLLFSCKKEDNDNDKSFDETIATGAKWGIQIGSAPADVYAQIQALGNEKGINSVEILSQKTFSKPQEIQNSLELYQGISLEKNNATPRVIFQFYQDKITSISDGGEVSAWPKDAPAEITIHRNDPIQTLYNKLLNIYKTAPYKDYTIRLFAKQLNKAFDPDMANFYQWHFDFSTDVKPGTGANSSVTLIFTDGKLSLIKHSYTVGMVLN